MFDNTRINENGILVFDTATQQQLYATSEPADFDDYLAMFDADDSVDAEFDADASLPGIDPDLMPSFPASDIEAVAERQAATKFAGVDELAAITLDIDDVPYLIKHVKPGCWTRMDIVSADITYLDELPTDEPAMIFDVETFVKGEGNKPIIAQAASSVALYCWLHPSFDGVTDYSSMFVPVGNANRALVAHNAAFDAARIVERYMLNCNVNWIDTYSIINCLNGADDASRWALTADPKKNFRAKQIQQYACAKSLVAAYNFYVTDQEPLKAADKKARNIFVDADDFQEFIDNQEELLTYSMLDIIYTHRLFVKLWRKFINYSNGYVPALGHSTILNSILPVAEGREQWIADCDAQVIINTNKINEIVVPYARELYLDWIAETVDIGAGELEKLNWKLHKPKNYRKKVLPPAWPTIPKWYYALKNNEMSFGTRDFARLLMLEYKTEAGRWRPLIYSKASGWCYIEHGEEVRMPHPSGADKNVGSIINKTSANYILDYKEPRLRSKLLNYDADVLLDILKLVQSLSLWSSFSNRVKSQLIN